MQSSSTNVPKLKSGLPQPVPKKVKTGSNQNHNASQKAGGDGHPPQASARDPPQLMTSSQHPLAAVMKKKKTGKTNQTSESWADVKVESQSQRIQSQSHSDSSRRKEDIERQLREAENELGTMSELIEKRERMLEEERSAADKKIEELEDRLMNQEGVMAEHGIDPVTGEKKTLTEDDKKKVEANKKITKKTVQAMREKLREMNRQTESFLADIENTMQYLSSLEDASERAGPMSEETQEIISRITGDDKDAIRRVLDENSAPGENADRSNGRHRTRTGGPEDGDDDDNDDDDDDDDDNEEEEEEKETEQERGDREGERFFITGAADCDAKVVDAASIGQADTDNSEDSR